MLEHLTVLVPGFPRDEQDTNCLPAVQNYVRAFHRRYPDINVEVFAFQYPPAQRTYRWHEIPVVSAGGGNRTGLGKLRTWRRILGSVGERVQSVSAPGQRVNEPGQGVTFPGQGDNGPGQRAHRPGRRGTTRRRLIHSFWIGECTLLAAILARRYGYAHVATIGGQELRRRTLYSCLLSRGRFVLTAGSEPASETARRSLGRPADAVIPLGLEADNPALSRHAAAAKPMVADTLSNLDKGEFPRPTDESRAKRPIDVLAVGSLIPVKRMTDVLAVAGRLPEATFVIAGDGPEGDRLRRDAPPNVSLEGELPRSDVLAVMKRSKVLLHPSEFESQGYVFLEALAAGMHVVCRDVGAPGTSSHVHRCRSTAEMEAAVRRVLETEVTFEPVAVPTAEETAERYRAVYESALEGAFDL